MEQQRVRRRQSKWVHVNFEACERERDPKEVSSSVLLCCESNRGAGSDLCSAEQKAGSRQQKDKTENSPASSSSSSYRVVPFFVAFVLLYCCSIPTSLLPYDDRNT